MIGNWCCPVALYFQYYCRYTTGVLNRYSGKSSLVSQWLWWGIYDVFLYETRTFFPYFWHHLNSARTTVIFSKKLLRTTNYHHAKSCLVPIYIFCIIIILSFTMTVGILMLHCGLGIRNTNTFYTFRCPQSLEMIRLYSQNIPYFNWFNHTKWGNNKTSLALLG